MFYGREATSVGVLAALPDRRDRVDRVADDVHAQVVGRAGDSGRGSGDHDDLVADLGEALARAGPSSTCAYIASVWVTRSTRNDSMPQMSAMRRRIASSGVNAFIGMRKRRRDIRRAESPDSVKTQTYLASTKSATSAAARVIAPPWVRGLVPSGGMRSRPWSSVDVDDAGHGLHRDDRVLADARLAGEHDRVGAVEHGVGDVGGLGAGRAPGWRSSTRASGWRR